MKVWEGDKQWSDTFIPQIKRALGEHLIVAGNWQQDCKEASDLLTFKLGEFRVGCRIRRNHYLEKYYQEFTIRQSRASGNKTEMEKIMEGWGSHFFYGFANGSGVSVVNWFLADLNVFRETIRLNPQLLEKRGEIPDGHGTKFYSFFRSDFPPEFIKASGFPYVPLPPVPVWRHPDLSL